MDFTDGVTRPERKGKAEASYCFNHGRTSPMSERLDKQKTTR